MLACENTKDGAEAPSPGMRPQTRNGYVNAPPSPRPRRPLTAPSQCQPSRLRPMIGGATMVLALMVSASAQDRPPDGQAGFTPAPTESITSPIAQPAQQPGQDPDQSQAPPKADPSPSVFEQGPGVLGISLRTLRQQQIDEYVTEPVALVAIALDDLRFAPVNKKTHVEVNLAGRVSFEGKGDKVAPKARRILDVIGRILADNPQTRIEILVHTDDQGDAGYNLRLSQRAAQAVKDYLVGKGVAAERITATGRGEEAPLIATGKRTPTSQERIRNRRVELVIAPLEEPALIAPAESPAYPVVETRPPS